MEHKKIFYLVVALQIIFLLGMIAFKQSTVLFGTRVLLKPVPYDPTDYFRGDYLNIRYEISTIRIDSVKANSVDFSQGEKVFVRLGKAGDYWKAVEISKESTEDPYISGIVDSVYTKDVYTIRESNSSMEYTYEETVYQSDYPASQIYKTGDAVLANQRYKIRDEVQFTSSNGRTNWIVQCPNGKCPYESYSQYRYGYISNIKAGIKEVSIRYPIETYFVPKNAGNIPQFRTADMLVEASLFHGDAIATNLLINGQKIDFR